MHICSIYIKLFNIVCTLFTFLNKIFVYLVINAAEAVIGGSNGVFGGFWITVKEKCTFITHCELNNIKEQCISICILFYNILHIL